MDKIRASAPAKVILFGEHFVVYGKRALAMAINKRLYVEVSQSSARKKGYQVKIADIPTFGLQIQIDLEKENGEAMPYKDYGTVAKAIAYVEHALGYVKERYGIESEGVEIEIKSEIPLSAGFGSSAATCVALINILV
jgi:mevalonate kinase